ncbi:hypothetical protein FRB90_011008, partial [Tulasnella sp. 427]
MPVPITMPVPEPAAPEVSIPPPPTIPRVYPPPIIPNPNPLFITIQTVTPTIPQSTIIPSSARPQGPDLVRRPTQEKTIVRRPSTESDRTVVSHAESKKDERDFPNALPDLPAPRRKGESYWEARGQHLYEDLSTRPKLKETFPSEALRFSESRPGITWNVLLPPSTAVAVSVADGICPMEEADLSSPATTPPLKV